MGKFRLAAFAAASVMMCAGQANAATIVLSTILNLGGVTSTSGTATLTNFEPFGMQVAEGDTVDWTILFANGASFTLDDPAFIMMRLHPDYQGLDHLPGGTYLQQLGTSTLQFLGESGAVVADFTPNTRNVAASYITGLFTGGPILPGPITFYGLRTTALVQDYVNIPETSLTFNRASLLLAEPAPPFMPIPEPSTWALMIGGFGLAGAALRRRRALA